MTSFFKVESKKGNNAFNYIKNIKKKNKHLLTSMSFELHLILVESCLIGNHTIFPYFLPVKDKQANRYSNI